MVGKKDMCPVCLEKVDLKSLYAGECIQRPDKAKCGMCCACSPVPPLLPPPPNLPLRAPLGDPQPDLDPDAGWGPLPRRVEPTHFHVCLAAVPPFRPSPPARWPTPAPRRLAPWNGPCRPWATISTYSGGSRRAIATTYPAANSTHLKHEIAEWAKGALIGVMQLD